MAAAACTVTTPPPPTPAAASEAAKPTPTSSPTPTKAPAAIASQPIKRSGTGRTGIGESFTLTAGLHKFTASHSGERNFMVDMKDAKGAFIAGLFNEIGKVDGKTFSTFVEKDGTYYLDTMAADGAWSVTIQ